MPHELDHILISYDQPNFLEKLVNVFLTKGGMSHFGFGPKHVENRRKVEAILSNVVERKDEAIAEYTEKFDSVNLTPEQFLVHEDELKKAHEKTDPELLSSIRKAIANVKKYQKDIFIGNDKNFPNGTGIKYTPIKRVGVCIPGASAPLPSTVIMTAVPAMVAGVEEIVVVSPPRYEGDIHYVTLAVCQELSTDKDYPNCKFEVYRIGGAQAVAALSFETPTIKRVDKIVGPGNQWVQTAKQLVYGDAAIDSIAGPSEVLIIADEQANPAWLAADMLSQAEHNPGGAYLFTTSRKTAESVLCELKKQVMQLKRSKETLSCLKKTSSIIIFEDMEELVSRANEFAAEHLQIQCGDKSRQIAEQIKNAGAIFIGDYSPVAVGDYWAGPSHTLPTGISAAFFSALSSNDFIKSTSIIEYNKKMLSQSAKDIIRLAETEGLDAHARSIRIRQES
ncbi:MAG: histidinol dehydrogenase [Sedimentisphaerales bacterium]|nr:histidinol dehydrogenase [Sedimentisphaerales bacterium]